MAYRNGGQDGGFFLLQGKGCIKALLWGVRGAWLFVSRGEGVPYVMCKGRRCMHPFEILRGVHTGNPVMG